MNDVYVSLGKSTRLSRKRHILGPSPIEQKRAKCDLLAVEIAYNTPQLIPDVLLVSGGNKIQDCGHSSRE